jgi:hypothetical protein
MASQRFCAEQIQRLGVLKDSGYRLERSFKSLWEALARYAKTNEEAEAAITLLLDDPQRAADSHRNGVPEPAELMVWVTAARGSSEGSPQVELQGLCGLCENGWVSTTFRARGMEYSAVAKCECQGGPGKPAGRQLELE